MVASGYDFPLVILSVTIAIVGAYVGLTLSERVSEHQGRSRFLWLAGGAISFGSAVWAMHFTGMQALRLQVPVGYDVPLVALSFLVAVLAGGAALFTISRARATWRSSLAGAVLMGGGIGGMHYIGMLAMRMQTSTHWNWKIIVLSVLVAVVFSFLAIRVSLHLRAVSSRPFGWHRVSAAVIMGLAISGMHYTGMEAATFNAARMPSAHFVMSGSAVGGAAIALIALIALLGSGFAMVVAIVDRRFTAQDTALVQSRRRLSTVVANAPVVIVAFDAAGIITIAEGRILAALGIQSEAAVGRSFFTVFEDVPGLLDQARRALLGVEQTAATTLGDVVLETHWTAVRIDNEIKGVIAVATDITERRHAEITLQHQARHDALTGLPNRALFNERLTEIMEDAGQTGEPVALARIDLDRFKQINDALGHEIGDVVLQQVAVRLRSVLREADLVARLGGDEFALLLPGTTDAQAMEVAQRVVAAFSAPYSIDGYPIDIAGSIGLALSPRDGRTAESLFRKADVAMHAAKRENSTVTLYDPLFDGLEERLRHAIQARAFALAYQPIYALDGRLTGCEALLRWPQSDGTVVQPNDFIPFAESSGLIVPIGAWVLRTACLQSVAWNHLYPNVHMSVNVSAKQVIDQRFLETVKAALADSGLAPELLELEFTETAVSASGDRAAAVVSELRALGIRIAVDDFGTGYNSLQTLRSYVVDTLKLDRCFVTNIVENAVDRAIAAAVITAAHALGARVVAEGIETAEQLAALVALHADCGQGFLFAKPLSAERFEQLLASVAPLAAA